ncbi:MAG: Ig domain-containing protein [bacterium]
MRKQIIILGSLLLLITLFIFCYQVIEPEYGNLLITIKWPAGNDNKLQSSGNDTLQFDYKKNGFSNKSQKHSENLPPSDFKKQKITNARQNNSLKGYNEIVILRFTLNPGGLVFEFNVSDSVYTIQAELGIYNLVVEALDSQGAVIFRADTTEILIQPNANNNITLWITPNYPSVAPEFIGFSEINVNNNGEYRLVWSSVPRAENYTLEEGYDINFLSSQSLYSGQDTTFQVSGKDDSTYYYRVRAENDVDISPWSNTIAFQVENVSELIMETDSLPDGSVGGIYSAKVNASGGLLPYSWEIESGSLPPGLETDFSYDDNVSLGIIGNPTELGSFEFTLKVTDSSSPQQMVSKLLKIEVNEALLQIITDILPKGRVDSLYETTIDASGGTPPYNWEVISGSLPPGLNTDSSYEDNVSLDITGSPAEPGVYEFTLQISDSSIPVQTVSKQMSLTIDPCLLQITTKALKSGRVDTYYEVRVDAKGGSEGNWKWRKTSGNIPDGLRLVDNGSCAWILGTPEKIGSFLFTVTVTDNVYPELIDSKEFTIHIGEPSDWVNITTASPLPDGTQGVFYSQNIDAEGGIVDWSWSIISGTLPEGINFYDFFEVGRVQGTPAENGTFNFTVKVQHNMYAGVSDTKSFSLTINASSFTITTSSPLPDGEVDFWYETNVNASGGVLPYEWVVVDGSLPPGLYLEGNADGSVTIVDTPTAAGTYEFTLEVIDDSGPPQTATKVFSITIN